MRTIQSLYRYPIKGLSAELLPSVQLVAGRGFPRDREFALTNGTWVFDAATFEPRQKSDFLMLMKHEALAALRTRLLEDSDQLSITHPSGDVRQFDLNDVASLESLSAFFMTYLDGQLQGNPKLARSEVNKFTDVSVVSSQLMQSVSLVNLASVRVLEQKMNTKINPLRFRSNVYFDGGEPWEELNWLGKEISIGSLKARVVLRTRRCAATNVDPDTGLRDLGIPQALLKNFRHGDMGVYVEILSDGMLHIQDPIIPAV